MLAREGRGHPASSVGSGSEGATRSPIRLSSWALVLPQLSDWWLKTAYLQYRQPLVIYSSPGVMLPKQDFVDRQGQLR